MAAGSVVKYRSHEIFFVSGCNMAHSCFSISNALIFLLFFFFSQEWPVKPGPPTPRTRFCGGTASSQLFPWRKASLRWTTLNSMPRSRSPPLRTAWKSRRRRCFCPRLSWLLPCATAGRRTAPWTVWRPWRTMTAQSSCPPSSRRSRDGTACPRSSWGWAPPPQRWLTVSETCPWSCSGSALFLVCLMTSRAVRAARWAQSPWASQWQTYLPNCSDWLGEEEEAGWTAIYPPNLEKWIPIALHKADRDINIAYAPPTLFPSWSPCTDPNLLTNNIVIYQEM